MTKLLICDKDGTLVKPKSGNKFVQDPYDQGLLPGVADRIAEYSNTGWKIVIASNQGGIAAKYKSLEATVEEMWFILELLPTIKIALFCADFEGNQCYITSKNSVSRLEKDWLRYAPFRKPFPGMIYAAYDYCGGFDWSEGKKTTLFVGDRSEDEQAALAANVNFQWADYWRSNPLT